jgi:hypothetical protein
MQRKQVGLAGFEPTTPCPPDKAFLFVVVRWPLFFGVFQEMNGERMQAKNGDKSSYWGILWGK